MMTGREFELKGIINISGDIIDFMEYDGVNPPRLPVGREITLIRKTTYRDPLPNRSCIFIKVVDNDREIFRGWVTYNDIVCIKDWKVV